MNQDLAVLEAGHLNEERVISIIALAFVTDPMLRWSYPEPHTYWSHAPGLVRALGGRAFSRGVADYLEGYSAAALWLSPGVEPDVETVIKLLRRSVSEDRLPLVDAIIEEMDQYHPSEPHWYLPFIGVDPLHQGQGLGAILLRHGLERSDRDGVPAYLEATSPRNIPFYRRHGFKALGTIAPDGAPPLTPMLRKAHALRFW